MSDSRLPKQLLYGELSKGRSTLSRRTEKRYKDSLKVSVKSFGICDRNRSAWPRRVGITNGARNAEDGSEAEMKRTARKARSDSTSTVGSQHTCLTCGKDCRAPIGLLSHLSLVVVIFDFEGRTYHHCGLRQAIWP